MKDLFIIGAGSVGGHVAMNFKAYNTSFKLKGFLDDNPEKVGTSFCGYPVLDTVDALIDMDTVAVVLGIAFPGIKEKILKRISKNEHLVFPSFVSPHAWVSEGVTIGSGSIIYPGCSINYGTQVGDFVVMNMNCAIGHDSQLGDFSSYAPGVNLGGFTKVGQSVDMGIGSSTKQFVNIGEYAVIGGQCMVIKDVAPDQTYAGVPGRRL